MSKSKDEISSLLEKAKASKGDEKKRLVCEAVKSACCEMFNNGEGMFKCVQCPLFKHIDPSKIGLDGDGCVYGVVPTDDLYEHVKGWIKPEFLSTETQNEQA